MTEKPAENLDATPDTTPDAAPGQAPEETKGQAVIDTVVLDFGNVLVGWDPYAAWAGHAGPDGTPWTRVDVDAFFDEIGFHALNEQADAGRSFTDLVAQLGRTHPHRAADLAVYTERYAHTLTGPVPGSEALVKELSALGLRLYGLTNWAAETFRHAEPAAPAIGLLDGVVVSGREGVAKPDVRIYRLLAERFGVDPARALFVDDKQENVDGARAAGFHAVRFTDTETLRADLRRLGLPV